MEAADCMFGDETEAAVLDSLEDVSQAHALNDIKMSLGWKNWVRKKGWDLVRVDLADEQLALMQIQGIEMVGGLIVKVDLSNNNME